MSEEMYLVVCEGRVLGEAGNLLEALQLSLGCRSRARVYYVIPLGEWTPEGARRLIRVLGKASASAPGEQQKRVAKVEAAANGKVAVVFDQMFKTFAEILDRELQGLPFEFHEVLGRGLKETIRISERVYQEPARDDYDVLRLLERLAEKHGRVVFFTGDKRLANQARMIRGVRVVYLPPGEVAGKEMALKLMRELLEKEARGVMNHPESL